MLALIAAVVAMAPADADERAAVDTMIVQVDGIELARLREELTVRVPALSVLSAEDPDLERPARGLFAYVIVHPKAPEASTWSVTVILSDGRAFFRVVDAPVDTAARVIATSLANLVVAAEAGTVEADATRELPPLGDEPGPPPAKPVAPIVAAAPPPSPVTELGLGLHGAVVAGFGPPADTDALVGGAGGLDLAVRLPIGFAIAIGARPVSRTHGDHRIVRVRATLGAGYVWRRDAFELAALGYVLVEPWELRRSGQREHPAATRGMSPVLVGGGALLSPGYRVRFRSGDSLRIGVRAELSGSAMPGAGVGRIAAANASGALEPLFRLGGFELSAGLELVLWLRTLRDAPRRPSVASRSRIFHRRGV